MCQRPSNGLQLWVAQVRLIELRAYGLLRISPGAARLRSTALESGRVLAAAMLWPLNFETGHWSPDFLTDRMTGSGRQRSLVTGSFLVA
jgi:hypothetical protein